MERQVAIITGTGSNLGTNIAYRLLEEIPSDVHLTIIVTSRSLPTANNTIQLIKKYNDTKSKRSAVLDFDYLLLDFSNMVSILNAYYELSKRYQKINYLYINSSQGVYDGINWLQATRDIISNPLDAVTNPSYKIQKIGIKSKDNLGLMFQSNVFGPYYFIKKVISLLKNGGKIIWISSIMSESKYLSFNDLQILKSDTPYETSKRMIDLLHLATYKDLYDNYKITQYLTHPGIFTSFSFFKYLNFFTYYSMLLLFYLARYLGSPWHVISGYLGANSIIFTSLKADINYDSQELKYGSACYKNGKGYIKTIEIQDPSGKNDILNYLNNLVKEWDEKLKDQILETRTKN